MESESHTREEENSLCRVESAAAPYAGEALYLNHPTEGWLPVLASESDMATNVVTVALGDQETGAFQTLYQSYYSNCEDLIVTDAVASEFYSEKSIKAKNTSAVPDAITDLPDDPPGENQLDEVFPSETA